MLSFLAGLWGHLISFIGALLPNSPFRDLTLPSGIQTGLGWLNWFVPFDLMIGLFGLWLAGLIAYGVWRFITAHSIGLLDDAVIGGGK